MTHTYAILEISPASFEEIARKLKDAGYEHAFHFERRLDATLDKPNRLLIDMHGIAVTGSAALERPEIETRCTLCAGPIEQIHFAIRDMKPTETGPQWFWRHIVGLFTVGFVRRKFATILPVCEPCVKKVA